MCEGHVDRGVHVLKGILRIHVQVTHSRKKTTDKTMFSSSTRAPSWLSPNSLSLVMFDGNSITLEIKI